MVPQTDVKYIKQNNGINKPVAYVDVQWSAGGGGVKISPTHKKKRRGGGGGGV